MKKIIVLSLGGSLIVPDKMDFNFLEKFKKVIRRHYKTHKFVVVCGGGRIARKYISVLKVDKQSRRSQSMAGIMATRMNARFMMQFFSEEANDNLPMNMKEVKDNLKKNKIVFCGALRYSRKSTSDTNAAKLANYLETSFINLTDVKGLYSMNPKEHKDAKFIPKISWKEFEKIALSLPHKAGQHFVLDQQAAILIRKHRISTYIIGKNLKNLSRVLEGKEFIGTLIRS